MASPKATGLFWEITWLAIAVYAHLQVGDKLVAIVMHVPLSDDLAAHFELLFFKWKTATRIIL